MERLIKLCPLWGSLTSKQPMKRVIEIADAPEGDDTNNLDNAGARNGGAAPKEPPNFHLQKCVGVGILSAEKSDSEASPFLPHPKGSFVLRCLGSASTVHPRSLGSGGSGAGQVLELQRIADTTRSFVCLGSMIFFKDGSALRCSGLSVELAESRDDDEQEDTEYEAITNSNTVEDSSHVSVPRKLDIWVPSSKLPSLLPSAPEPPIPPPSTQHNLDDDDNSGGAKDSPISRTGTDREDTNVLARQYAEFKHEVRRRGSKAVFGDALSLWWARIRLFGSVTRESVSDMRSPRSFAHDTWSRVQIITGRIGEIGKKCQGLAKGVTRGFRSSQTPTGGLDDVPDS